MEEQSKPKKLKTEQLSDYLLSNECSSIGSNSTKTTQITSSDDDDESVSNGDDGFGRTNQCIHSILIHPMSFPLLIFLNDIEEQNHHIPEYTYTTLNGFNCCDKYSRRDHVFAATVLDWEHGETDFAEKLLFNINQSKIGESLVKSAGEKQVVRTLYSGKVDFIFHKKASEKNCNNKSSVVALFKFGINNSTWLTKQDQIIKYVDMLRTNKHPNYKIDQPLLISVITSNESMKTGNEIKSWAKEYVSDDEKNI